MHVYLLDEIMCFFKTRAVNARTKAHAAELAAKQSRNDSEYARIRAHEVAPDFIQPGSYSSWLASS